MPFDGKDFPLVTVPTVKPFDFDTATPDERLLELARLLENEQEWRDSRMAWDFNRTLDTAAASPCGTAGCAMGLAHLTWSNFCPASYRPGFFSIFDAEKSACKHFNITLVQYGRLFDERMALNNGGYQNVTPGMVATAIRQFVANRQSAS